MWLRRLMCLMIGIAPVSARACDIALLLAVDVSGSVDPKEYRIQMDGLAAGMRDGVVVEALVQAKAAVALMQWTGEGRQALVVPWTSVESFEAAEDLALAIEAAPRSWDRYSTAIGDALLRARNEFDTAPDCRRRVIDVSGDGISNEGAEPSEVRRIMKAAEITVNALVIETDETDLTAYFWENVITGSGAFVVTANGFEEYPKRIREKLIREVAEQISLFTAEY
ncbi:DUF1194 domain-containing protein [Shimia abyssi]|uniref:Ca-activated chloride channel family protein n=1 Tax=Shimia abyssi TaxID=1662395 RepID=A0A2P8FEN6_9RHOB|nr:DUF1194 domain-containing protein [Shimia abyssi]PSL20177.1 Ca-activated chloride channel family protein [Shimia abyssi]